MWIGDFILLLTMCLPTVGIHPISPYLPPHPTASFLRYIQDPQLSKRGMQNSELPYSPSVTTHYLPTAQYLSQEPRSLKFTSYVYKSLTVDNNPVLGSTLRYSVARKGGKVFV